MIDKPSRFALLPNGRAVRQDLYDPLIAHVRKVIPELPRNVDVTLKQMCGDDFWESLDGHESLAGQIISCLVKHELLDLMQVGCEHRQNKKYRRR